MKIPLLVLTVISLFSCKTNAPQIRISELSYGTSSSKILSKETLEGSPSGTHLTTDFKLNIIEKSDIVEAKIGVQFGAAYIIIAPHNQLVELTTVWTYPSGVKDKSGKELKETRYKVKKYTNENTYSNFTIEYENELAKGDWTLELFLDNARLYKRVFHLK